MNEKAGTIHGFNPVARFNRLKPKVDVFFKAAELKSPGLPRGLHFLIADSEFHGLARG